MSQTLTIGVGSCHLQAMERHYILVVIVATVIQYVAESFLSDTEHLGKSGLIE